MKIANKEFKHLVLFASKLYNLTYQNKGSNIKKVYITQATKNLPGNPISNEELHNYIHEIDKNDKIAKRRTLMSNGIKTRHFAINKDTQEPTQTNAEITATAIRMLNHYQDSELLVCGTSQADLMAPSHSSLVHGELTELGNVQICGVNGICCSGIYGFKYAFLSVSTGDTCRAICSGSDNPSAIFSKRNFTTISDKTLSAIEEDPAKAFSHNFLRWMLSDGAGAFMLSATPTLDQTNLLINWIEIISYANEKPTCMFLGGAFSDNLEDTTRISWKNFELTETNAKKLFTLKQDVGIVREMPEYSIKKHLKKVVDKHGLTIDDIAWFFPHMSSKIFKKDMLSYMAEIDFVIPEEKWFTNLSWVGNVGAASFYLMIEEALNHGIPQTLDNGLVDDSKPRVRLKKGEKILCMIPESGRFANAYVLLTVE